MFLRWSNSRQVAINIVVHQFPYQLGASATGDEGAPGGTFSLRVDD